MLYGLKEITEELSNAPSLNPYFVGKCSTATNIKILNSGVKRLNPYFVGKCSTALRLASTTLIVAEVLILILLENALRHSYENNLFEFKSKS